MRAPASRFSPRSAVLLFIQSGSRFFIEKHEYINVNSKRYIHRNEREIKLKAEQGKAHTILLYYYAKVKEMIYKSANLKGVVSY